MDPLGKQIQITRAGGNLSKKGLKKDINDESGQQNIADVCMHLYLFVFVLFLRYLMIVLVFFFCGFAQLFFRKFATFT